MKKILIELLLVVTTITSWAYDFSAVAPSGQTLYYTIVGNSARVTYPGNSTSYSWTYGCLNYQNYTRPTGKYGYHFTQWNDGNADNPRPVVVDKLPI